MVFSKVLVRNFDSFFRAAPKLSVFCQPGNRSVDNKGLIISLVEGEGSIEKLTCARADIGKGMRTAYYVKSKKE